MNKIFWVLCLLAVSAACSTPNTGETPPYVHYDINFSETAPDTVYQAAQAGMSYFYNLEPSQYTLGNAFRNYYIQSAARSNCNPLNVAWLLGYNADIWNVIAVVDDSTSYLLDIDKNGDSWAFAATRSAQDYINLTQELKTLYPQYTPVFYQISMAVFSFPFLI